MKTNLKYALLPCLLGMSNAAIIVSSGPIATPSVDQLNPDGRAIEGLILEITEPIVITLTTGLNNNGFLAIVFEDILENVFSVPTGSLVPVADGGATSTALPGRSLFSTSQTVTSFDFDFGTEISTPITLVPGSVSRGGADDFFDTANGANVVREGLDSARANDLQFNFMATLLDPMDMRDIGLAAGQTITIAPGIFTIADMFNLGAPLSVNFLPSLNLPSEIDISVYSTSNEDQTSGSDSGGSNSFIGDTFIGPSAGSATVATNAVPEPSTSLLAALGLMGLLQRRKRS